MNLIKQFFEVITPDDYSTDSIMKHIERCGRTSYKSEDRITSDSYKKFTDMLYKRGHLSPFEFGTVYLKVPMKIVSLALAESVWDILRRNQYTKTEIDSDYYYFTTNMRVLIENHIEEVLEYSCKQPEKWHEQRITVKFITNRAVSHELVRHRVFSFIQESQRYCNYSKDKFGDKVTFIIPAWCKYITEGDAYWYTGLSYRTGCNVENEFIGNRSWVEPKDTDDINEWHVEYAFIKSLNSAESSYFKALEYGWKPQQARVILPNACKTEIVMCGFVSDWKHFFKLRDSSTADPQMQDLVKPLHEYFKEHDIL